MTNLSQEDVDKIADALVNRVRAKHHEFWIDPENHYQQHLALTEMLRDYQTARKWMFKVFLTLIAAGAAILAGLGVIKGGR
jgi:hypothetical protein